MFPVYESLLRPILFMLSPENAQRLADQFISSPILSLLRPFFVLHDERLNVDIAGLKFHNPIILAAGYDKNCALLNFLPKLGFGGVVAGTITQEAKSGNPSPRILRRTQDFALVNSLGFPNVGLAIASQRLAEYQSSSWQTPMIASVSGVTVDEISACVTEIDSFVDALELNISSPNTAGLRAFQQTENLKHLLSTINSIRTKPLFVKLPRLFKSDPENFFDLLDVCLQSKIDGIVLANTLPIQEEKLFVGQGGLSGYPLLDETLEMVSSVRQVIGEKTPIIASGGVSSGQNVIDMISAGANAVQVYTGFVYGGPGFVKRANQELLNKIELLGISEISEMRT